MSLAFFEKLGFSPTNIVVKTANYTALTTDDQINISGSGVTLTLPSLLTLQGTMMQKKMYAVYNNGTTYDITIQPGTNANTNVADTINSKATYTLKPNETIVITGYGALLDWLVSSPQTLPNLGRNYFCKAVNTNGTTAVNVFDANGAPDNIYVDLVLATAGTVTSTANITVLNATNTLVTIAKSTTAYVTMGMKPAGYQNVAKGAVMTVASDGAVDCTVVIIGSTQSYVTFTN